MANNVSNVNVGKPKVTGSIYVAPFGTTLPTDAAAELNASFLACGYVSEDGVTNSNSPETESLLAWGGDVVYSSQTSKEDTFSFSMIESSNVNVLKTVYGEERVTGTYDAGLTIEASSDQPLEHSWVIDMALRDGLKRIVIPRATISEMEDITYADSELIGYGVTLACFADSDGVTHVEYLVKNKASSATSENK